MNKTLTQLAQEYDFETGDEYLGYIVDSCMNGQRQQVRNLFNELSPEDKIYFLNEWLTNDDSTQTEVLHICISEMAQAVG